MGQYYYVKLLKDNYCQGIPFFLTFFLFARFLCSEEDEGFSTEPVANKQNGGPLGFYFNQKVLALLVELKQLGLHRIMLVGVHFYEQYSSFRDL